LNLGIWRDVGLYIIASLTIIIFGAIGTLGLVAAIILLCLYGIFVISTYIIGKLNPNPGKCCHSYKCIIIEEGDSDL